MEDMCFGGFSHRYLEVIISNLSGEAIFDNRGTYHRDNCAD